MNIAYALRWRVASVGIFSTGHGILGVGYTPMDGSHPGLHE